MFDILVASMNLHDKLETARQELNDLKLAYKRALSSYEWETKDGDSSRRVRNQSIATLSQEISKKEREIETLEHQIETGHTGKAVRVGVIWG